MLRSTRKNAASSGGSGDSLTLPLHGGGAQQHHNGYNPTKPTTTTNGHAISTLKMSWYSSNTKSGNSSSAATQKKTKILMSAVLLTIFIIVGLVVMGAVSTQQHQNKVNHQRHRGDGADSSSTTQQQRRNGEIISNNDYSYEYDVVVIGAGPAGLTAALFAARAGLSVLILGSDTGQLSETMALDNFPSFYVDVSNTATAAGTTTTTSGQEWLTRTKQQVAALPNVQLAQAGLLVSKITTTSSASTSIDPIVFTLEVASSSSTTTTNNIQHQPSSYTTSSRAVIVASGATSRRLQLPPYEEQLWGISIHSCAICDGSSYTNRTVVVVGGGDAAVDAALLLARHARHVILIHRRTTFRASNQNNVHALYNQQQKIQIRTPYIVEQYRVVEQQHHARRLQLTGVDIRNTETNTIETIECDGVFVMIGSVPNTVYLKGTVLLDNEGLVQLQQSQQPTAWDGGVTGTMRRGIFAAGEVTDNQYRQAITAASAGAQAAIDAERWLRQQQQQSTGTKQDILHPIPLQSKEQLNKAWEENHQQKARQERESSFENTSHTNECDLIHPDCIKSLIHKYRVVVFQKSNDNTVGGGETTVRQQRLDDVYIISLSSMGDDERNTIIQDTLEQISGHRLLPNVFVSGTSIVRGGSDTTKMDIPEATTEPPMDKRKFAKDCDLTKAECIVAVVESFPVVVFSKTYCPYCRKAIEVLHVEGVSSEPNLHVIELDTFGEKCAAIQDTLEQLTGRRTVPNIFIGGKPIGGFDQTAALHIEGTLRNLLEQAKAYGTTANS